MGFRLLQWRLTFIKTSLFIKTLEILLIIIRNNCFYMYFPLSFSVFLFSIKLYILSIINDKSILFKIPDSHLQIPPLDLKLETYSKEQNNNDDLTRTKVFTSSTSRPK